MATVEYIHIAPEASKPMIMLPEAEVIAGAGIKDDRYANKSGYYSAGPKPGRQVTLIEAEVIEAIARERSIPFTPHDSRRNITTRGIRLNPLVGSKLRIGTVILEVIRLCDPCKYLEGLVGQPVLQPLVNRGGIRCDVLTGGVVRVGETISVLD
jgi:MOSC domain-containing protein YiiM